MDNDGGEIQTELACLRRDIADLARKIDAIARKSSAVPVAEGDSSSTLPELALAAAKEYRSRRNRTDFFPASLFGEPAWDMLLELFIQRIAGKTLRTSSLCIASNAPASTALRWLDKLAAANLIERQADPDDARVTLIGLSPRGFNYMREFFNSSPTGVPS